ncbi:MAG: hypothetical protein LQ350_004738 [Teloschistes chrysophthalmus]|nr:MAG: hypothetical protein LQ350_004738 [Niorma chrysophthalma]
MCGIFVCYRHPDVQAFKQKALRLSSLLSHRGPDSAGFFIEDQTILCHERLSIVGLENGEQPIVQPDLALIANGEIYNHEALRQEASKHDLGGSQTDSDSEAIIHAYRRYGSKAAHFLDGIFSFALYDRTNGRLVVARDPMGVTSLYQGWNSNASDAVFFASELKALHPVCDYIISFPPGHTFDSMGKPYEKFYNPQWKIPKHIPSAPVDYSLLRTSFEQAVRKRLMSDVPYGVLLSGGLDSSLVASIAAREVAKASGRQNRLSNSLEGPPTPQTIRSRLSTFSIGLKGSPDIVSALKVAEFLGTDHHTFHFTCEEGIAALSDVIYHIETYDVTSIRASTPMYLLSKHIKAAGYKMVLSGEGSDEIFGGYLYFANAPSLEAFQQELVRRVGELHYFDCLRAHKSTMAWGVEARVPFLDKQVSPTKDPCVPFADYYEKFVDVAMSIDPREKFITGSRIEKYILRKAFSTPEQPYLPDEILWRQKEQFSDGVGYGWINMLKAVAAACITPQMMASQPKHWVNDPPTTKEAYVHRHDGPLLPP